MRVVYVFSVLVLGLFLNTNAESAAKPQRNRNEVLEKWKEMDKVVTKMTGSAIKMVLPQVMEIVNELNMSAECLKESMQLISGLRRLKVWAFKFLDSSSKIMDGIFSGTVTSTGVYEQCLNLVAPSKDSNKALFKGKYCQIEIVPPLSQKTRYYRYGDKIEELKNFTGSEVLNFMAKKAGLLHSFPYKLGICVPSGCNAYEIGQIAKAISERNYLYAKVNYCDVKKDDFEYTPIAIIAMLFCSILGFLVSFGTGYEVFHKKLGISVENFGFKVLQSFSVISNIKTLFNINTLIENTRCLYGMRFLSITMVVFGHSYFYPLLMMHMYQSQLNVYEMMKKPLGLMILNSHVAVETFFFLGGFLVCYMAIKREKIDNKKLSIRVFIFRRLWRIVPVYYFIILISMLTPFMGSGPNFKDAMKFSVDNCYKYWWTNLLFINNFFKMENLCMIHTWFISCDIQLYMSSLIVILPLLKSKTVGITLTTLIIIVSIIYTGAMTYFYELVAGLYTPYLDKEFLGDTYLKTYANPITHAGPYYIGVLVGFVVAMNPDIKILKKYQILGWLIAILCGGYTMFWTSVWRHYTPSTLETAAYAALHRNIWAIGLGWMTFCCSTGHGGFINKFLAWRPWIPLAKLSFLIYLIQPILQTMHIATFQSTHEFNHLEMVITYFGFLLMSGLVAFLCHLIIESPLMTVEKLFLRKLGTTSHEDPIVIEVKYTNGDIHIENRNGLELKDFTGYMDNKAFDHMT